MQYNRGSSGIGTVSTLKFFDSWIQSAWPYMLYCRYIVSYPDSLSLNIRKGRGEVRESGKNIVAFRSRCPLQARRKHIFFGQAKFDRHDHAYSVIQREHSIDACMRTSTFAHAHAHSRVSTQLVTPPFSHKYWSGQNRTNRTACAGPALFFRTVNEV